MQIGHLLEFLALATNANFSETAKELYITQSTLSRHINALEEEIGAKLFSRDAHQIALTPIGAQFAADAKTIVRNYEQALDNIDTMKRFGETTLRIGYLYDVGTLYMPTFRRYIQEVADKEGVRLKFSSAEHGELMTRLLRDTIDVAITIDTDPRVRDFSESAQLGLDSYYAVVPVGHPLAEKQSVSLKELSLHPFIAPDPYAMSGMKEFIMRQFHKSGVDPNVVSFYEDIPTFFSEVAYGSGIGLALGHHKHRYEDHVVFIPLSDCDATCNICCIWKTKTTEKVPGSWPDAIHQGAEACRDLNL